ncbi:MAG: hypothetical protein ACTSYR_01595, partial [Candidatus Odinarchaeia archaeon]
MKRIKTKLIIILLIFSIVISIPPLLIQPSAETVSETQKIALNRIFIIGNKPGSFEDEFATIATIPLNIFMLPNGSQVIAPIIKSDLDETSRNFSSDWMNILGSHSNNLQAVVIGDLDNQHRKKLEQSLDQRIIPRINYSNIFELSSILARFDWLNSDNAVIAVVSNPQQFITNITQYSENLNFDFVTSNTTVITNTTLSGEVFNYSKYIQDNVGWVSFYVEWLEDNILTHEIIDPTGFTIDNTTQYSVQYINSLGSPKIYSVLPNVKPGLWTFKIRNESNPGVSENFTLTIKEYPGIRKNITIPENTLWLNLSIDWNNPYVNLDLFAISPSGRLVDWDILPNDIYPTRTLSIPFPENGTWEILVGWWEGSGSLSLEANIIVEQYNSSLLTSLIDAQNGAVIASLLNAPLLYASPEGLSTEVNKTLQNLKVKDVVLLDIANTSSSELLNQINSIANIQSHIINFTQVYTYLTALNYSNGLILTYPLEEYSSISTILAVSEIKPVLTLGNENITSLTRSAWCNLKPAISQSLQGLNTHPYYFEGNYLDERVPYYYSMREVSDEFNNLLNKLSIEDNLTITVFSPVEILPLSFERSILGKHIVGRFSNSGYNLDGVVLNSIFRDFNPQTKDGLKALLSFYAYSHGANFTDNNNITHPVFNRDNISQILLLENYTLQNHIGQWEIKKALENETDLWILTTHGYLDFSRLRDHAKLTLRETDMEYYYEPGMSVSNPDRNGDGLVDPLDWLEEEYRFVYIDGEWFNTNINKLNNTNIMFIACLVNPAIPNVLLNKGAGFILGAYRTVNFQAASWFSYKILENLLENKTIGEALVNALINCSIIYSNGLMNKYYEGVGDFTLQYVLYGNPEIKLCENDVDKIITDINNFELTGHAPSKGISDACVLGKQNYLQNIIDNLNVKYDFNFKIDFINISKEFITE